MAYTKPSISAYNTAPPSDDGSTTEANKVKWSTIKTKITDPVKVLAEAINDATETAFNDLASTTTDDGTLGSYLVNIQPFSTESNIQEHAFAHDNVLRFIPHSLHDSIRDGTNATDLSTYIQNALDGLGGDDTKIGGSFPSAAENKGGEIKCPPGSYLCSNIKIWNGTYLVGSGRLNTIFIPFSISSYVLKVVGSHGGLRSLSVYNKNALASVVGIGIVPVDETQTTVVKEQNYNQLDDFYVQGCETGLLLRAGPDVASVDSGCWYNEISHFTISGSTRGIWFKEGPNASSSGANRNSFFAGRVGQSGCNVGVQFDDANTNSFVSVNFEGIQAGTSPLATPTCIYIPNAAGPTSGSSTIGNKFVNCEMEGVSSAYNVATGVEWLWVGGDLTAYSGTGQPPDAWIDVKFTSFNHGVQIDAAAPATPAINTMYRDTIVSGWGAFTGAAGTLLSGVNCSVVRNGTGNYTVTLATAFVSDNAYAIVTDCIGYISYVYSQVAGSFDIQVVDPAGTAQDPSKVFFTIVGAQN